MVAWGLVEVAMDAAVGVLVLAVARVEDAVDALRAVCQAALRDARQPAEDAVVVLAAAQDVLVDAVHLVLIHVYRRARRHKRRIMIKKLSKRQTTLLQFKNYLFTTSYEKLIFMIDHGIKDMLESSEDYTLRPLFTYALIDAVYRASDFYYSLLKAVDVIYNIKYDLNFSTGIIEYTEDETTNELSTFDPFGFMINSAGFNDEWKEKLKDIYENSFAE